MHADSLVIQTRKSTRFSVSQNQCKSEFFLVNLSKSLHEMRGSQTEDLASSLADVITITLQQIDVIDPCDRVTLLIQVVPMFIEMLQSVRSLTKSVIDVSNQIISTVYERLADILASKEHSETVAQLLFQIITCDVCVECTESICKTVISIIHLSSTFGENSKAFSVFIHLFFQVAALRLAFLANGGFETTWCTYIVDEGVSLSSEVFGHVLVHAELFADQRLENELVSFVTTVSSLLGALKPNRMELIMDILFHVCQANAKKMINIAKEGGFFTALAQYAILHQDDDVVDVPHFFEMFILLAPFEASDDNGPWMRFLSIFEEEECGKELRVRCVQVMLKLATGMTKEQCPFEVDQLRRIGCCIPKDDHLSITFFSTFCFFLRTEFGFSAGDIVSVILEFCSYDLAMNINQGQNLVFFVEIGNEFAPFASTFFEKMFKGIDGEQMARLFDSYTDLYTLLEARFDDITDMKTCVSTFCASLEYVNDKARAEHVFKTLMTERKGYLCIYDVIESDKSGDETIVLLASWASTSTRFSSACITENTIPLVLKKFDQEALKAKSVLNYVTSVCRLVYRKDIDELIYEEFRKRNFLGACDESLMRKIGRAHV